MGWLGDFFGGVANTVTGGLIGSLFGENAADNQQDRNLEMMRQQYEYQKNLYQNRYQWTANDLKKAGYNPIIAATNGIGGSPNGVGLPSSGMSTGAEFANAMSSAYQASSNKEIAKLNAQVQREGLELRKIEITNAKEKQDNEIKIQNGRFELEKWTAEQNVRLKEIMQDAQIKNMVERLQADIEHMARQDANGAVSAAAAMAQANASGLMAAVQEKLGISREQLNEAQQAYIALQSENANESLKWQKWLNDHPYTRGAVGLLGSVFDTAGLVTGASNLGSSLIDMVD